MLSHLVRLTLLIQLVLRVIGAPLLSVLSNLVRLKLLIHSVPHVRGALVYLVQFESTYLERFLHILLIMLHFT